MTIPAKLVASKTYRVTLTRAVELAPGHWARPGDEVSLTGADVERLRDAIANAEIIV